MWRVFIVTALFLSVPFWAHAAFDPMGIMQPDIAAGGTPVAVTPTFYGPGASGNMQGGYATARPEAMPPGVMTPGRKIPHTLDDVRLGRSEWVTLASAASNYDKWYQVPMIRYRSPIDDQWYTMQNVVGFVHDTGCAFNGSCPNFGGRVGMFSSQPRPDKFDIAVGDFRGRSDPEASSIINGSTASRTWLQIGGPVGGTTVTASPYTIGTPIPIGGSTRLSGSGDNYCIVNIDPVIVYPRGSVSDSQCYNLRTVQQPLPLPPQQQPQPQAQASQSQISQTTQQSNQTLPQQLLQTLNGKAQSAQTQPVSPAATLLVQPAGVSKGNPVLVSWSSVGMKSEGCRVRRGETVLGQKNEGTRILSTGPGTPSGPMTFIFECTALSGQEIQKMVSIVVN
ncbi:MAG: hypothetical protein AAB804_02650 [Patescibacteria group bacterium]